MNTIQLEQALLLRLENHKYLRSVSQGRRPFPYVVDSSKTCQVSAPILNRDVATVDLPANERSRFVLMLPVVLPKTQADFEALLNKFWAEGSKKDEARKRVFLVIGVNCRRGVDSSKLNALYDFVSKIEKQAHSVFVTAFSWDVQYTQVESFSYDVYKSFRILKLINPRFAETLRKSMDRIPAMNIPYVNIREAILTNEMTQKAFDMFKKAPTYLGIMDPDAVDYNRVIDGATDEIESYKTYNGYLPDMFACGYEASEEEPEVIRLGLKIDREIRSITNNVIGGGSYFSEVFVLFRVKKKPSDFSFKTSETEKNQNLESRRLLQNALRSQKVTQDRLCFGGRPIITSVMDRMRTQYTEKNVEMTRVNLYTKTALKCLCGLTYSHLSPREWANNLYTFLGVKSGRVTNMTSPMQIIFKAVHPIYAAYDFLPNKFEPAKYENFLLRFRDYLEVIEYYWGQNEISYPKKMKGDTNQEYNHFKVFIDSQISKLLEAYNKLVKLNVPEEKINKIFLAAFASGYSTSQILLRANEAL